ncbi:MAG: glycine betaine ABC transporter substrate-binding protein [Phycisphaerales bacterium JB063]
MRRVVVRLMAMMVLCSAAVGPAGSAGAQTVRVGSKNFTEQQILGELVAQLIEMHTGLEVERQFGLSGTDVCHAAMVSGELDVYVEYTGTGLLSVLKRPVVHDPEAAYRAVSEGYAREFDLVWLPAIGFNNTYALTVKAERAEAESWASVSDLMGADGLRAGFTGEFMERPDGLPGLRERYGGLVFANTVDLDPGLMYQAVAEGQVDVICAFATDGRIEAYGLATLEDDRGFFPPYDAAPVVRGELLRRHPELRTALAALAGQIDDAQMRRMNYAVDIEGARPADVAAAWLASWPEQGEALETALDAATSDRPSGFLALVVERRGELFQKTVEHLVLTVLGVGLAVLIGVPLGVWVHRAPRVRGPVLAVIEMVQTVPSLAMLAFLFAVYGLLGATPAVTALVFYALLPIVLNTYTGLNEVPARLIEAANGVGMSNHQRLRLVELPLALPVAVAGVRAATVLTVGIATLCTFIGAGGLGDFIARGLARNDPRLTLLGAVPAAIMAVLLSLMIRLIEQKLRRA